MIREYRKKIGNRELKSEINIIPLLDVLLVLVLIFMATDHTITQIIKVDLSNLVQSNSIRNSSKNVDVPIIIETSKKKTYSLVMNQKRLEQLSSSQLITQIRRYMRSNPKVTFLISGTKNSSYKEIIEILDLLFDIGIKSVGLITKQV